MYFSGQPISSARAPNTLAALVCGSPGHHRWLGLLVWNTDSAQRLAGAVGWLAPFLDGQVRAFLLAVEYALDRGSPVSSYRGFLFENRREWVRKRWTKLIIPKPSLPLLRLELLWFSLFGLRGVFVAASKLFHAR
jgi:hypothetical protein